MNPCPALLVAPEPAEIRHHVFTTDAGRGGADRFPMSTHGPRPNLCPFTGCTGDCWPRLEAAAWRNVQTALTPAGPARPRLLEAPLKTRDSRAQRKLLVAVS